MTRGRLLALGALGALAYSLAMLAMLPAELVLRRPAAAAGIVLDGVDGTVWHGSAAHARRADLVVDDLRWTLSPWRLLTLHAVAVVDAAALDGRVHGVVDLSRSGRLVVDGIDAELPLAPLATRFGTPAGMVAGSLRIDPASIALDRGSIAGLECRGRIDGLEIGVGDRIDLGALTIACEASPGGPRIHVADDGGPLSVALDVLVSRDGRWSMDGTLGARPGAPAAVREALPLLGAPSGKDRVRVRLSGAIPLR